MSKKLFVCPYCGIKNPTLKHIKTCPAAQMPAEESQLSGNKDKGDNSGVIKVESQEKKEKPNAETGGNPAETNQDSFECGSCGVSLMHGQRFCSGCGVELKWE